METYIVPGEHLNKWLNQPVGFVKLNHSYKHLNNSFECAAWWEESQVQTGKYPLVLKKNSFAPYHVSLYTQYDAVVIDDYFPALWAGSPISNQPYTPKRIGEARKVGISFDLIECVEQTGHSPGNKTDFYVDLEIIPDVLKDARSMMASLKDSLDRTFAAYLTEGDGMYNVNLEMTKHYSNNLASISRAIAILNRRMQERDKATDYSRELFINNTSWAQL